MTIARSIAARLARTLKTPKQVQQFLRTLPYNKEVDGESLRSAEGALRAGTVHCLEATFIAAAILEHHGFPPLALDLGSDDDLDHVVYAFQGENQRWGAIGRSRFEGLHGRAPVFRSIRDLVWSYVDPFVDETGRISGYSLTHLDDSKAPWRDSRSHVWTVERHLIKTTHIKLRASDERHERALRAFRAGKLPRKPSWW